MMEIRPEGVYIAFGLQSMSVDTHVLLDLQLVHTFIEQSKEAMLSVVTGRTVLRENRAVLTVLLEDTVSILLDENALELGMEQADEEKQPLLHDLLRNQTYVPAPGMAVFAGEDLIRVLSLYDTEYYWNTTYAVSLEMSIDETGKDVYVFPRVRAFDAAGEEFEFVTEAVFVPWRKISPIPTNAQSTRS